MTTRTSTYTLTAIAALLFLATPARAEELHHAKD